MDKFKKNVEAFREFGRGFMRMLRELGESIVKGSPMTKVSMVIFGFAHILRKQFLRGFTRGCIAIFLDRSSVGCDCYATRTEKSGYRKAC